MVNRFYSNMHKVVQKHCKYGGTDVVWRHVTTVYDPETSGNIDTYTDYYLRALVFDYERYNSGDVPQKNNLVAKSDKMFLIDPLTVKDSDGNVVYPSVLPEIGDKFLVGSEVSTVYQLKELSPDASTPVMLEVQTRF